MVINEFRTPEFKKNSDVITKNELKHLKHQKYFKKSNAFSSWTSFRSCLILSTLNSTLVKQFLVSKSEFQALKIIKTNLKKYTQFSI